MSYGQKSLWEIMVEQGFACSSATTARTVQQAPTQDRRMFREAPGMVKIDSTFTVLENKIAIKKDGM